MKIVLIGNYTADHQASMQRYALYLERELRLLGHDVQLLLPGVYAGKLVSNRSRFAKWMGYIDKYLIFRIGFSRQIRDADIVHVCDHSNSPYLAWVKGAAKVITCHDALAIRSALGHFPQNRTKSSGKLLQKWIRNSLAQADRIVYVSNKTREDFEQLLGIRVPSDLIPHALNWSYSQASEPEIGVALQPLGIERNQYIIHVGSNQWYKNRLGVLQMFAELRSEDRFQGLRLLMVGKPFTAEMRDFCRANHLDDVIELVGAGNEKLRVLYSGALALLFPSLEEGFGWPVLEAQACGCPVITSQREPMSEIAGNGAQFVDPFRLESVHEAVQACVESREEIVAAGFRNLKRFSSAEVIGRYQRFYQSVIGSSETAADLASLLN